MTQFEDVYKNKKVLITGHTGFKGSWLSIWLNELGADVYGISKNIPTQPSNFVASRLENKIHHYIIDLCQFESTKNLINRIKPDFVFHLAAQPIVKDSFIFPQETFKTNILGTLNVLESLRSLNDNCVGIIITSDKCYHNSEWTWGYRENDRLGGDDPYSASKGGAELVINSYASSFFYKRDSNIKIASARAGNVIGGGDWAKHRIIPDTIQAWIKNEPVIIRNPSSTRPWQHVLEPLSGYLTLGKYLYKNPQKNGEAYNFGPNSMQNYTVEELLSEMQKYFINGRWRFAAGDKLVKESNLLKLNCDKALQELKWFANLDFEETIRIVCDWYLEFYKNMNSDMYNFSAKQIEEYVSVALHNKADWC